MLCCVMLMLGNFCFYSSLCDRRSNLIMYSGGGWVYGIIGNNCIFLFAVFHLYDIIIDSVWWHLFLPAIRKTSGFVNMLMWSSFVLVVSLPISVYLGHLYVFCIVVTLIFVLF